MPSLPILSYDVANLPPEGTHAPKDVTPTSVPPPSAADAAASLQEATKLMNKAVYAVQMALYNGLKSTIQLNAASTLLTQSEYSDVVTERSITKQCGYPICKNTLRLDKAGKGRYHISIRDHKVYSLEETRLYCSPECIVDSKKYCAGLRTGREGLLGQAELEDIVSCVRGLTISAPVPTESKSTSAGLSLHERLTDKENLGLDMDFHSLGPADAIEGYIPRLPALESPVRKGAEDKSPKLKSAMKQSPRKHQRITWADEKPAEDDSFSFGTEALFDVLPGQNGLDRVTTTVTTSATTGDTVDTATADVGNVDRRLGIAQAVAEALSDAASAAAAGKVDASEAVSSTGLSIVSAGTNLEEGLPLPTLPPASPPASPSSALPGLEDDDDDEDDDGQVAESETPASDSYENDSWLDAPPAEYKVEVSSFGAIWMALDGWVSAATIAHLYNRDGHVEEFRNVNNRVEARYVDEDISSSEIATVMAGCISRVLPDVLRWLKISTPVSVIEQSVGRLLRTLSFTEALPGLNTNQWRMISLLFMDALSTFRLAPLGPQIAKNRDAFLEVLKDSGTDEAEYERYKELLLPLGRS